MNVVDSSGWLEYFIKGPSGGSFKTAIRDTRKLVVPVLTIYEVYKKYLVAGRREQAHRAITLMEQGLVIELNPMLARDAAHLSIEHKLPMADATILATARAAGATLWTMDQDFEGLPGVEYVPRRD